MFITLYNELVVVSVVFFSHECISSNVSKWPSVYKKKPLTYFSTGFPVVVVKDPYGECHLWKPCVAKVTC